MQDLEGTNVLTSDFADDGSSLRVEQSDLESKLERETAEMREKLRFSSAEHVAPLSMSIPLSPSTYLSRVT